MSSWESHTGGVLSDITVSSGFAASIIRQSEAVTFSLKLLCKVTAKAQAEKAGPNKF
jgi:hypothetical protein